MSLTLVAAVAAAAAASFGYLSARRSSGANDDGGAGDRPPSRRAGSGGVFAQLPLALGDVVMAGDEERWLAGAIVAQEKDDLVAVVFMAPEGAQQGVVAVFPPPRRDIYWLAPWAVDSPDEPPATLEIAGMTMRRRGRLPAALKRIGQGAPPTGEAGIVALYEGGGSDVALVIASEGRLYAWAGRRIDEDGYERLGGGGTGE